MEFNANVDASSILSDLDNLPLVLNTAFRNMADDVVKQARDNIDTGRVGLNRRSGRLTNSLRVMRYVQPSSGGVGSVTIGSNTPYAAIHEEGGIIRPKRGQYLTFQVQGRWVRVKQVTIPARPYLKPAVADRSSNFSEYINNSLAELTRLI